MTQPIYDPTRPFATPNSNYEDNPFQKLPDALLLLIFDKILDLEPKTLASCFLVSKHLASLIFQTYTNTIFLPMEMEPPAIPQSRKPSRRLFKTASPTS